MAVPRHACVWYPISTNVQTGKPAVYACGSYWGCIKTVTPQFKGRGKGRMLTDPTPTMPVPDKGMWKIAEKGPKDLGPRDTSDLGAGVPERPQDGRPSH